MEIKECRSQKFIFCAIKQKLEDILDLIEPDYKNELVVYKYNYGNTYYLAQSIIGQTKIFGIVIHEYRTPKDLAEVCIDEGILKVLIIDPFLYPIMKKEFTDFAEIHKENIKKVNFIKDF